MDTFFLGWQRTDLRGSPAVSWGVAWCLHLLHMEVPSQCLKMCNCRDGWGSDTCCGGSDREDGGH